MSTNANKLSVDLFILFVILLILIKYSWFPGNFGFNAIYHTWKIWFWMIVNFFFPERSCLCLRQAVKVGGATSVLPGIDLIQSWVSVLGGLIQHCLSGLPLFVGIYNSLSGVLTESLGDLSRFFFLSVF